MLLPINDEVMERNFGRFRQKTLHLLRVILIQALYHLVEKQILFVNLRVNND